MLLTVHELFGLRQVAGLSIYTLAPLANVHWQTILNAERGDNLRPETRAKIEAALGAAVVEQAHRVRHACAVLAGAA